MESFNKYKEGDVLTFKKKHPCGSFEFIVVGLGVDYKLKCKGCGREIIIPRNNLSKYIRK